VVKNTIKKFIPGFLLGFYYWLWAFASALFYRFPSRRLKVIGVTGTNGKSSVVFLTAKILEEAGFKTASLSSIEFKIGEKAWRNVLKMTMPGRFIIQKFLNQAVKEGCQYAVLEVTSEGIKQHRHRFIDFDVAIFTNLTPEHIESHGSFERYLQAKAEFFLATKGIHIINIDDENAEYFWRLPAEKKLGYSKKDLLGIQPFNLKLPGEFNLYNALAALYAGLSQGISLETCKKSLEKVESIPGRMETIIREPFSVIVDYAHTPDALEKVYKAIEGSLICVLGAAGGGRDKWKRPELGKIAARYCKTIILTNEDPYEEDQNQILSEIESGIPNSQFPLSNLHKIMDRREAIRKAISLARAGEAVIITGKGCEPWMMVGRKKIPWDDRKVAREEFKKLGL
jgi:UDP-N-acetylmuramoyl-L-alanyl-D-glutamate--2,6-diaminopimelate ligase